MNKKEENSMLQPIKKTNRSHNQFLHFNLSNKCIKMNWEPLEIKEITSEMKSKDFKKIKGLSNNAQSNNS